MRISPRHLLLFVCPALVMAQVTGSINGTVVDASNAAVSGATLALTNKATGEKRQITSSADGYFNFVDLGRGEYSLTVQAPGFREVQIDPLSLTVGQALT